MKKLLLLLLMLMLSGIGWSQCVCPTTLNGECPTSAILIDACNTDFNGSTIGYTNWSGNATTSRNVDCNLETHPNGNITNGYDVPYSVENDSWFYFCPGETGIWNVTISTISCIGTGPTGTQLTVFQGNPSELIQIASTGGGNANRVKAGESAEITFVVSDISAGCIYIQTDGFAGSGCSYTLLVNCVDCCVILPIELLSFTAKPKSDYNLIQWSTASESNNDRFILDRSEDGVNWRTVEILQGAGNSSSKIDYFYKDINFNTVINYYRLTQIDFDGTEESFNIISVDNRNNRYVVRTINMMGQEIDESYTGLVIYQYSDGTTEKIYK